MIPVKFKPLVYRLIKIFDDVCGLLPALGQFKPLRGSFLAIESLRKRELEGSLIAPSQEIGLNSKGSLTDLACMQQHDYQPWPIFWVKSQGATLAGRMLFWRNHDAKLCSEGVFHENTGRKARKDLFFAQSYLAAPHALSGNWTSLLSNWGDGQNYYHWITDCLTRLSVRDTLPEHTKILIPSSPASYVKETMELLGLTETTLAAPGSHLHIETFYFCSPTAMTGAWNPYGWSWLQNKFSLFFASEPSSSPIFVTRRNALRIPANLDQIETVFSENGFRIIDCGEFTVKEQIHLFSSAPAIAGLHGAAMTNLLWARPNTPVLEICEKGYLNACYEQIAIHGKLKYEFLLNSEDLDQELSKKWIASLQNNSVHSLQ